MDEFERDESVLETLKSMAIIPSADGQITSLSEKSVFFPLNSEDNSPKDGVRGRSLIDT